MQSKEQYGVKTGRLAKPKKPEGWPDLNEVGSKAVALCKETQQDVVVYVDERQSVTYRAVNDSTTMHVPAFVLYTVRWAEIKKGRKA